jgi:putative ABC transport system permease protein
MFRYALRNLLQNKIRLVISVGGVALALSLILALDAIMTGVEGRLTAYIDNSGANVFVSQAGVRNLHMVSSSLPASVVGEVQTVPGVAAVTPIMYLTDAVEVGPNQDQYTVYVIGLPQGATMGGPWRIAQGVSIPADGQTVIDRGVAEKYGLGIGDQVKILGQAFTIAGLSDGTGNLLNSVVFISLNDFARLRGNTPMGNAASSSTTIPSISFVLVKVKPGAAPDAVAARIEKAVPGVTAQSREAFATQERKIVKDMATDLITTMNLVGFLVGLAVMALTVYIATLSRRGEYGILKAVGARNRYLYGTVLAQALYSVVGGFALALTITFLLSVALPNLASTLTLQISGASLLKVGIVSLVIAALSALLPIRQIAGLDPARVFKGARI